MEMILEWFEDDQFWLRFAPVMFDPQRWAETPGEVASIINMTGTEAGSRVLDSCCGVGRHSLEFARRGYQVTAIDRTRGYIEAAREPAAAEELDIEFMLQDVRFFRRPDYYDLALNLFTSFGFFSDQQEELRYIENIRESLKPGGVFVIDVNGKEILSRDFVAAEEYEMDGYTVRGEYTIEDDFSTLNNIWSLKGPKENYNFRFSHRIYSALELKELLLNCGFESVCIKGGFDGRPYDHNAQRLISIARK
jgi:SAM-dependent methyltransferase